VGEPLLGRERLIAKIENALGRHRSSGDVFLVSAPAGYGKSTLLAHWAATTKLPVAWYHVDPSDEDPAVFLAGLVHVLRDRFPRAQWTTSDLLRRLRAEALSGRDAERALELLVTDIHHNVTKPMALIVTGVAELSVGGATRAILDRLLTRPPDHLRMALEFREIPPLRFSPLLTQRRLDGIGVDDLKLDDEELRALLKLIGAPTDDAYVERVRELCAGWVTGVVLATGALTPRFLDACSPYALSSDALNRAAVFDYLTTEVIDGLPAELSDFACETAVLSYMTAPLCDQLLGISHAHQKLAAFERQTGFVTRFGHRPSEPAYRLQPLLRQALLDRLDSGPHGPERRRKLHARAGRCLEEAGDAEEAFQQYLQAEAFDSLIALIERVRGELLRACRGTTLVRWLDALPMTMRNEHPELQVLLAELYRQADRMRDALDAIEGVCEAQHARGDADPALSARALAVRAGTYVTLGRYAEAQADSERALRIAPPEATEIHVQAGFILATCLAACSTPERAHACLEEVAVRCAAIDDRWTLARLNYLRSKLHTSSGELDVAESEAHAALLFAQEANDEVIAITSRLNLGAIRQALGRYDEARDDLEAARAQADIAGYKPAAAYALSNLGDLELALGNCDRAVDMYEQSLATMTARDDLRLRAYTTAALGYVLALQGQTARAMGLVAPLLDDLRDDQHGANWALLASALGAAYYRAANLARAEETLVAACESAQRHGAVVESGIRSHLYLSAVRLGQGRQVDAVGTLSEALDMVANVGGSAKMLPEVQHLPELWPLIRTLHHPLAGALLDEMANHARGGAVESISNNDKPGAGGNAGSAPGADVTTAPAPRELRVFALGDPCVFVGSDRIVHWQRPYVRELLYFMVDQRKPVRKETILDVLWPDKNSHDAETAFRKTRHYLKSVLGFACLEQSDGRWRFTADVWLDVREFERLAEEGERLARDEQSSQAALVLRQALTHWRGSYLEDCYSDWAFVRRDALQSQYLRCIERLMELEMRLNRHESAMQLCYQMLDVEPHNEAAHRSLMTCFARRGEYVRAFEQFKACVEKLAELGASPGPKTLGLFDSIRTKMQVATSDFVDAHR
jgi:LuxR family maltose regulon positive regulatory protein